RRTRRRPGDAGRCPLHGPCFHVSVSCARRGAPAERRSASGEMLSRRRRFMAGERRRREGRGRGARTRPKPGLRLGGRYELVSLLGRGGYSEVWEAADTKGDGVVAVKLLDDRDPRALARVRGELAILRLRQIPGVVRLLDEGVSEEIPFLVMEL